MPKPRVAGWTAMLGSAAVMAAMPAPAVGQWPNGTRVVDTPHNLTRPARNPSPDMVGRIVDYGEVCVYCHAPHGGSVSTALWNRQTPTGPYRMYSSATISMVMDPQPTGHSLACLSCHDGTIGLDVVTDQPNTYSGPAPRAPLIGDCEACHDVARQGFDFRGVWLRTDLRDDHPISITYDPTRDPNFRTLAEVEASGLRLYAGKVQCMTCHEPHSQQHRPFLRISNTGGNLCLACHRTLPVGTAHGF